MVVDEDHDALRMLLEGGDDRLAQHEVGPVADEGVDLALRRGELHAERPRDLVPHARIAVFHVVLLAVARPPELVEISRERARGAHHHVRRRGELVHRADDLALRRERLVAEGVEPCHLGIPLASERRALVAVRLVDAIGDLGERLQCRARVELRDVHVDEARLRVRERRPRRGGEVGPASADADNEVGSRGDPIRGRGSGRADRAEGRRMVIGQRALSSLRLGDRYPRPLDERAQRG